MACTSTPGSGTMKARKKSGKATARRPCTPRSSSSSAAAATMMPTTSPWMICCDRPSAYISIATPKSTNPAALAGW